MAELTVVVVTVVVEMVAEVTEVVTAVAKVVELVAVMAAVVVMAVVSAAVLEDEAGGRGLCLSLRGETRTGPARNSRTAEA